jgi:hypothetical protein
MTKHYILDEIRRAAKANDGVPLGCVRFFSDTGIKEAAFLVPSPLNGERVRVRGGSAKGLLHFENATAFLPLTPALSPLRREGEPFARVSRVREQLALSQRFAVRVRNMNAANAERDFGNSADTRRVPSPHNGEKVAEGRMRGGPVQKTPIVKKASLATAASPVSPARRRSDVDHKYTASRSVWCFDRSLQHRHCVDTFPSFTLGN